MGGKIWGQCEGPDTLETETGREVGIGYQLQGTPPVIHFPHPLEVAQPHTAASAEDQVFKSVSL